MLFYIHKTHYYTIYRIFPVVLLSSKVILSGYSVSSQLKKRFLEFWEVHHPADTDSLALSLNPSTSRFRALRNWVYITFRHMLLNSGLSMHPCLNPTMLWIIWIFRFSHRCVCVFSDLFLFCQILFWGLCSIYAHTPSCIHSFLAHLS